jgi:hypothetical protein
MEQAVELLHERTLLGAVDSYLKGLVHNRPFLANRYSVALESLSERWLAAGGANALAALDANWVQAHLEIEPQSETAQAAVQDFFRWAVSEQLIPQAPTTS